jgi:hypothetical protein
MAGPLTASWKLSCSSPETVVNVIFSLDYEIHGNGEGCPRQLMVEPTDRLLRLFDEFGGKLTILADIGEILKFKEYAAEHGTDKFHYQAIAAQLQRAVRGGHDVQLHIHSSYFNARHDGQCWVQDWSEYNFAGLDPSRMTQMIGIGKKFLEELLQPAKPDYRCTVFRAANWSVSPSPNVVRALLEHQIHIDTSIFKYGVRQGLVNFDYHTAPSEMLPWLADTNALWRENPQGRIWEVPIYSEHRRLGAFLSLNRVYRAVLGRFHRVPGSLPQPADAASAPRPPSRTQRLARLLGRHAWKADFNQCTGVQLIRALKRGAARHDPKSGPVPFVLIGHSKLFTAWNERSVRPFLAFVAANGNRFRFGTYDSLGLPALTGTDQSVSNTPLPVPA